MTIRNTKLRVALLTTAAFATAGGAPAFTTTAHAQALQPVVDVCTGISLEPSAITDIVGDVAVPTATAVEDLYGALIGVSILGTPILTLDDVEIGAAETLQAYADGDPIALRVADTSGTLLAADSPCNLTADGYTLSDEAGLAIGGNQITGLGNGQVASAGELDAIAFGNNARTAVGANGAIAIGTNANATVANGIALGNGSLADRGALTGYTAYGLAGINNSVGSVSVGAPGSLRQITNVAAGTQATDAATVGQVQGAVAALEAALGNGVQYDNAAQTSVTLAGAGGTTISNVADGELSAGSDQAVNGSQLFATNQLVDANTTAIVDLDGRITINAEDISDLDDTVTTIDTRVTQNTTDIDALQTSLGNLPIGYVSDSNPAVASSTPTNSTALIGAVPGGVTLSNVANGQLTAGSSQAVNGSQLFATNQQVEINRAGIQANADAIAAIDGSGDPLGVIYDDATRTSLTLDGAGGTTIGNVAAGELSATSDQAVNGAQLFTTNQAVAANTDAIVDLDGRVTVNETNIANLDDRVTINEGDIADLDGRVTVNEGAITDLGDSVTAIDTRVTQNTTDIDALQTSLGNLPIGYVSDSNPAVASSTPTNSTALIGAVPGGVTLSNVANGQLTAGSSQAVNGSQLFATNQQVEINRAGIQANADAIAAIDGSGDPLGVIYDDATRTSLTLDGAGGTTIGNVAAGELSATSDQAVNGAQLFTTNQAVAANTDAIVDLDGRVTVNETNIANLDDRVTINEGDIADLDSRVTLTEVAITGLDDRVTINEGDITDLDARVTVNEGDISTLGDRVTVNEGDITNLDARVTDNSTQITLVRNQLSNVPVGYVSDTDPSVVSDTPTNTAALIGAGGDTVRLTNVAAGTIAAGSTDAVNGAQLAATNSEVARNRTDIDQNTADIAAINNNLAGSTVVAVQYSNPDNPEVSNGGTVTNDVTLVGADATAPVALHNVAAGTRDTDAVNLGQMQSSLASAMTDNRAYTDMRFGELQSGIAQLDFDLRETRQDAFAGTASAMAVSGIPQTIIPGRSMVGGGVAHYRGETAFAVGMSTTFNDGRTVVKAGATMDTRGNGGVSAGAGFSF